MSFMHNLTGAYIDYCSSSEQGCNGMQAQETLEGKDASQN